MINLLYAGNDGVFDGLLISLLSIAKKTEEPFTAYVLTMDLLELNPKYKKITEKQADFIQKSIQKYNLENSIILVDCKELFCSTMLDSPNLQNSYTPYALLRLFADKVDILPNKVLYLDTDTIANSDISKLYHIKLLDDEVAGVLDYNGQWFIGSYYINSGVLLMNLEEIKRNQCFEKCREYVRKKKSAFSDQNAINRFITKRIYLERKYNEQRKYYKEIVIQHFAKSIRWLPFFHTVNVKPWPVDDVRKKYKIFAYDDILNEYLDLKREFVGV